MSAFKDMTPSTPIGKIIASFCAVIGIMMLALPLGVISSNFNAFEKYSIRFRKIMESKTNQNETLTKKENGNLKDIESKEAFI